MLMNQIDQLGNPSLISLRHLCPDEGNIMVTYLHLANLIYCQGCLNNIFQIIKVGQHIFKHLHKEKELIPQGFFSLFGKGS